MSTGRAPWALIVAAALTLACAAWGAAQWSLIPVGIDDEVIAVRYQSESGYRWRTIELDDGRELVVDRRVTDQFDDWERLDGRAVKAAGERELLVGDEQADLALSFEFWKVVVTVGAIVGVAVWRATRSTRGADAAHGAPPDQ